MLMKSEHIPRATIQRLSIYLQVLENLQKDGVEVISSEPLADIWNGAEYLPFPTFPASDEEDPAPTMLTFYLSPGKYKIQLQGCPKYNYADISAANQVICLSLRGTCMDYN